MRTDAGAGSLIAGDPIAPDPAPESARNGLTIPIEVDRKRPVPSGGPHMVELARPLLHGHLAPHFGRDVVGKAGEEMGEERNAAQEPVPAAGADARAA